MWVIPALHPLGYGQLRLGLRPEALAIEQLALESYEQALNHRVVVGITDRAQGWHDVHLATTLAERITRASAAVIALVHDLRRTTLHQRRVERPLHELRAQVRLHRPASDLARPYVQHHCQV